MSKRSRSVFWIFAVVACLSSVLAIDAAFAQQPTGKPKVKYVTMKQAKDAALANLRYLHPDAKMKVERSALEPKENKVVYSFNVRVDQQLNEVWVDPESDEVMNTIVVTKQQEAAQKAKEKAEAAAKKAAAKKKTKPAAK